MQEWYKKLHSCIRWRRQWQPTPVLLPGKSHGRSLVDCSPWGREESDTTEQLHFHFSLSCIGEGNGNPLQCSCLENLRDGAAWWAAVYGVTQSRTRLKRLRSSSSNCIRFITKQEVFFLFLFYIPLLIKKMFFAFTEHYGASWLLASSTPTLEARSFNHWATREVPQSLLSYLSLLLTLLLKWQLILTLLVIIMFILLSSIFFFQF